MDRSTSTIVEPKFTRGEKCIFLHLVLTFVLIIVLVLIYATHLYFINHTRNGIFITRKRVLEIKKASRTEDFLVGYIFLNLTTTLKFICNTLLLQPHWSLCTAHCVAMRTDPALRHLFFDWGLTYKINTNNMSNSQFSIFTTGVKNTIVHPFFNRESFGNNIGLVEHAVSAPLLGHTGKKWRFIARVTTEVEIFNNAVVAVAPPSRNNFVIFSWNHSHTKFAGSDDIDMNSVSYDLEQMIDLKCKEILAPITALRNYEFCVTLKKRHRLILGYGSVVFANSKPIGIFSWGERMQKALPLVIINITLFQDWIEETPF